jgi:hypothetical protein
MFENLRVILGTLLSQRIAEIVMGFGEVWILSKRLFELT